MKTETVIEFLDELYWVGIRLTALPDKRRSKKLRNEEIAILRKLKCIAIQRFETELTAELAPLVCMLRALPLREQLTYAFDGPRYVAAILLVQHLHKHQN